MKNIFFAGFSGKTDVIQMKLPPDNQPAEAEEKTSETVIQKIFDELPVP